MPSGLTTIKSHVLPFRFENETLLPKAGSSFDHAIRAYERLDSGSAFSIELQVQLYCDQHNTLNPVQISHLSSE
jgi:hypothetical protein